MGDNIETLRQPSFIREYGHGAVGVSNIRTSTNTAQQHELLLVALEIALAAFSDPNIVVPCMVKAQTAFRKRCQPGVILSHRPRAHKNGVVDGPQTMRHRLALRTTEEHLSVQASTAGGTSVANGSGCVFRHASVTAVWGVLRKRHCRPALSSPSAQSSENQAPTSLWERQLYAKRLCVCTTRLQLPFFPNRRDPRFFCSR